MLKKIFPNRRRTLTLVSVLLFIVAATTLVFSWGSTGHRIINLKAVLHLPDAMASLRNDSLFYANHASDPDFRKVYTDTSFYAEAQRHYIDIDWYPNYHQLPHSLDSMFMLYGRATVWDKGTQPWATMMVMDSLTAQFARGNISKAESTMADLGHYVGDAHQPLHCTQNFDGQYTGNSGIHSRYETGMINLYQSSLTVLRDSARYISAPLDYVFAYIYHANSYVDSIMAADTYAKVTSGWNGSGSPPSTYYAALWQKTQGFTKQQFQDATLDLASLWYTAWINSQAPPPIVYDTITTILHGLGTIAPSGIIVLLQGNDTTITFSPSTGYHLDSVTVDGIRVDSLTAYTFENVASSHIFSVWFGIDKYLINATAGQHGTISPSGVSVVNYGDSKSFIIAPAMGYLVDSVVADGNSVDSLERFTFANVMEDHTLSATFKQNIVSLPCPVEGDWNLVSVPLQVEDGRTSILFPTAISRSFGYGGNYVPGDSLIVGAGYWLKFPAPAATIMTGTPITIETLIVHVGWNLTGSISSPISVTTITSDPPGMATSQFFEYTGSYTVADSIHPSKGYWVSANQEGKLILSAIGASRASARIRIVPTSETPPSPPVKALLESHLPSVYALEQAFPNPFNPATTIQYALPFDSRVKLEIFNIVGENVYTLIDRVQSAGMQSVTWDAGDMPSGLYFCRFEAVNIQQQSTNFVGVKKVMLVK